MSKSSNIAIWIALALPLLTAPLWADGIVNGGGSTSSGGVATACGGVANSVLFNHAGSCTGDTGFTYAGASGLVTDLGGLALGANAVTWGPGAGQIGVQGGIAVLVSAVPGIWMTGNAASVATAGVFAFSSTSNAAAGNDTGFSRSGVASVSVGNGTAANASGGMNMALLSTTGSVTHQNLVAGTNADFLCLSAAGIVFLQTSACTISSLRFKPDWKPYTDNALTKVSNMEVGTFHIDIPNNDPNWRTQQAGLNAENIAKIAPECAVYENDMKTPKSYRQECVIALLVKAVQQLKK